MKLYRIKLPHGEADSTKVYTMSNPDTVCEAAERVHEAVYRTGATPDPGDLRTLLSAVSDYLHLTTYELGQEHCVRQLRDMWRARRAMASADRSSPSDAAPPAR